MQLTEEEILRLQRQDATLRQILAHPRASRLAEQAFKEIVPNAATPRLDADAAVNAPIQHVSSELAKLNKRLDDDAAARKQDEILGQARRVRDDGFAYLRNDLRYTDEGIKKVEEIMEAKGLLDPRDAAAIFEKTNPPPAPVTPSGVGGFNFIDEASLGENKDIEKLLKTRGNDDSLVDRMAKSALNEFRQQAGSRR